LDALAAGGFHGDTGDKELAMKDDSGAAAGKVKKATVTDVHNCCTLCTTTIKSVVSKVEGVTGSTVKSKQDSFEVTGDFSPAELAKALNDAGFHVKIK
jgi:hypothetical protein